MEQKTTCIKMATENVENIKAETGKLRNCSYDPERKVLQNPKSNVKGTPLQEFYQGNNIFVTGATGFLGKVLIEKLLRSCPGINRIYLLVRSKKGRSVEERINDLVNVPLFDRLRLEYPEFKSKLHSVAGDIALVGLGIGDEDRRLLSEHVHVVFHVAATVRFDEKLNVAIGMNVRGTRELLALCRSVKGLKSVVHVSTAYSNCPWKEIDECFYPPPLSSEKAIAMAETIDSGLIETLNDKILGLWPNTYAFTKALSEDVVKHYGQGLPVGVFRPAVVISTSSEPMCGWIDNMYGPTGAIVGHIHGVLRTMQIDRNVEANVVPGDLVINGLIASAWDIAENRSSVIPVYNYVAPHENKILWTEFITNYSGHAMEFPVSRAIWYPVTIYSTKKSVTWIYRILLHFLPAILIDLLSLASGKETQMVRLYKKVHKFTDVIAYFCTQQWHFKYNNVSRMWQRLNPNDQELFNFDMMSLDWKKFISDSCPGLRMYLVKESPDSLQSARNRAVKLRWLHRATVFGIYSLAAWLLWIPLRAAVSPIVID